MQHARPAVDGAGREARELAHRRRVRREPLQVVEGLAAGARVEGGAAHGAVHVPVARQVAGGWRGGGRV